MKRSLMSALITAALGAALIVTPTEAMPVREFGPAVAIGAAGVDPYGAPLAVLPDGTTAVAWTTSGNTVHMAVRKAGTNTFTELTARPVTPGYTVGLPGIPAQFPALTLLSAGSEFLLSWIESGATPRVQVARVSATATAIPAPVIVSGSGAISGGTPVAFGTATDGSAVAVWLQPGIGMPYEIKAARRNGVAGPWQQLGTAGSTNFPYDLIAAIDTTRAVTLGWKDTNGSSMNIFVRSHQGGAWGLTFVAGTTSFSLIGSSRTMAAATSGTATVIAVSDRISGTSGFSSDSIARGIRVLQRSSASAPWTLTGTFVGPGRWATSPGIAMVPDGSAVLSFLDFSAGTDPSLSEGLSTMVVQRRGVNGDWSAVQRVSTVAAETGAMVFFAGGRQVPALAPDGTLVVPVPVPLANGSSVSEAVASMWRPGWSAPFTEQRALTDAPIQFRIVGLGLDPAGRATLAYLNSSTLTVTLTTTALPKPFARSRAALSPTTPRVGTPVTCNSTWTGAKTLATRWLRNSTLIAGATATTYTPRAADLGKQLSCRVTATNPTGSTVSTSIARRVR